MRIKADTPTLQNPSKPEEPLTFPMLREYFLSGCKKASDFKVGVEWEKLGVHEYNAEAIGYTGERGVEAIFRSLIREFGWKPILAGQTMIALKKNNGSITLEPGGQIELSGQKSAFLDENAEELYTHLTEIKNVSKPLGIVWLGLGAQPISTAEEIEWVPKPRYTVMREILKKRGDLTYSMMKETASVQVSLDYTDEADAIGKLRLAMALAPFLTAIFANSPLQNGKAAPFYSRRANIWAHTDPDRTGILWKVFDSKFNFDTYVEYALNAPMLFLVRSGEWMSVGGMSFKDFMEKGLGRYRAQRSDWEMHLTGIFMEARLKQYVEIRSIDCQQTPLGLAAVAFLKALFYDKTSGKEAWRLLSKVSLEERAAAFAAAPSKGLRTPWKKGVLLEPSQELLRFACAGMERLSKTDLARPDEVRYLGPLKEILDQGLCPAAVLIKRLGRSLNDRNAVKKILEYSAI